MPPSVITDQAGELTSPEKSAIDVSQDCRNAGYPRGKGAQPPVL